MSIRWHGVYFLLFALSAGGAAEYVGDLDCKEGPPAICEEGTRREGIRYQRYVHSLVQSSLMDDFPIYFDGNSDLPGIGVVTERFCVLAMEAGFPFCCCPLSVVRSSLLYTYQSVAIQSASQSVPANGRQFKLQWTGKPVTGVWRLQHQQPPAICPAFSATWSALTCCSKCMLN